MLMPRLFGDSLFDNFFLDGFVPTRFYEPEKHAIMKTDVKEKETGYELDIELPGYKKEDVTAELNDGYLTIKAVTKQETPDDKEKKADGRYVRKERYYGSCQRSFYVGDALTEEDIKAKFENGILKLDVPKKEVKPAVEEKKYVMIQ